MKALAVLFLFTLCAAAEIRTLTLRERKLRKELDRVRRMVEHPNK